MRILYVTTVSLTMNSFFKPHIEMLINEGNQVDIACNSNGLPLDHRYTELGCNSYQIDFSRAPLSKNNVKAYKQLKQLVERGNYDIVHCHTPNASVITRFVCRRFRKKGSLKVFYTAHGFHFFRGAPMLNWLVYYPVEKVCSYFTDVLITINQEDYALAQKKMKAKKLEYVPGIGIDLKKFGSIIVNKVDKRKELGVPDDAVILFSVGELNKNKNHETVIRAIAGIENVYYIIAGKGELQEHLQGVIDELGLSDRVKLLGFRNDVGELCAVADIYVMPSFREGLSVALMEAMASGLPCVVSRIRGNTDLIDNNGGELFDPHSAEDCRTAIEHIISSDIKTLGTHNSVKIQEFSLDAVNEKLSQIVSRDV